MRTKMIYQHYMTHQHPFQRNIVYHAADGFRMCASCQPRTRAPHLNRFDAFSPLTTTASPAAIVANYLLDSGLNDARLVFPGMAVAICAVVVGAITQSRYARYDAHHGLEEHDAPEVITTHLSVPEAAEHVATAATAAGTSSSSESDTGHAEAAHASAADDLEQPLIIKVHQPPPLTRAQLKKNTIIGLLSATTGGVLVALFVPAVNIACNDQFHLLPPGVQPLSIWTANFFINLALAITCIGMGVVMLYWPQLGGPRSSLQAWFFDNNGRPLALLSGVLNASGNMFQYMAGQRAGFAAAALSQTFPVVTTVLGLVAFREFRGASRGTAALLALQVGLYISSATILAASFKPRSD
jgi:hypothetical protein